MSKPKVLATALPAEPVEKSPVELASAAIRGLTQDQILALYSAGALAHLDKAALWDAYMGRVAARAARKGSAREEAA